MTRDPYEVLGVSPQASEEEIKSAYRKLAKRYHPDVNPNDPSAEEKMREVNDAYDRIKNKDKYEARRQAQTGPGYGGQSAYEEYRNYGPFGDFGNFGGYGGYTGSRQASAGQDESNEFRAARSYISAGYFDEALHVLSQMSDRTARWYYYSALAHAGSGDQVTALSHAQQAVQMEPQNMEYQTLYNRLSQGGTVYTQRGNEYGFPNFRLNPLCLTLCAAQLLCGLFSGAGGLYPLLFCI